MSFLTEQIGPLPGGAWLGVIGGGLAIGLLGRRRAANTAAAVPVRADTPQDQSTYGAVQLVGPTGSTSMGTPKYATNEEWAQGAVAYLIGRGTLANRATNAISHVLWPDSANPTSAEDSALYNMAAGGVGLPPSLPSQAYIPDPPAVGPPTAPPSGVTAHATQYDAAGRAISSTDTYGTGQWAVVSKDLSPTGQTTGFGLWDRLGNVWGYYVDSSKSVTSAFSRSSTGVISPATAEQVAAANAANVGKGYA